MPDIKVKNYHGEDVILENATKVYHHTPESTIENPIKVPFTYGEAVSKSVELDFSNGDMEVPIAEGELVTELTIPVPEGLMPENIAKDVEIAGVVGTLAGGANCKIAYGLWSGTSGSVSTIEHGLGVVPDMVIIAKTVNTKNAVSFAFGISTEFYNYLNQKSPNLGMSYFGWEIGYYTLCSSSGTYSSYVCQEEIDVATSGPGIHNATAESFRVGSTAYYTGGRWIAISGLTG